MKDSLSHALDIASAALLSMNPGAIVIAAEQLESEGTARGSMLQLQSQISAARNAAASARALLEPLLQSLRAAGEAYTASGEPVRHVEGSTKWVTF
jgi:hypothetical protein